MSMMAKKQNDLDLKMYCLLLLYSNNSKQGLVGNNWIAVSKMSRMLFVTMTSARDNAVIACFVLEADRKN